MYHIYHYVSHDYDLKNVIRVFIVIKNYVYIYIYIYIERERETMCYIPILEAGGIKRSFPRRTLVRPNDGKHNGERMQKDNDRRLRGARL